jgi:hypothetical protein
MMSKEQQQQLDGNLRQGGLDTNGDVRTMRAAFSELMSHVPVPLQVGHRACSGS